MDRACELAKVRALLASHLPKAQLTTNDDANPATPMIVRATWNDGRIVKVIRADSPSSTPEQFGRKALDLLVKFQEANVPSRHWQQ